MKNGHPGQGSGISLNKKLSSDDILTDFICCWLISAGVLLAIRQLFRFEHTLPMILLRSGIVLFVTVMITRRWWHTVLILSLAALFTVLILWVTDQFQLFRAYIIGLLDWWIGLFPIISFYNTPSNISFVLWVIAAFVSILVFILVRRVPVFAVMASLTGLLIFIIYMNGFRQSLTGIAFIGAGLFPLLVRSHYGRLERRLDGVLFSRRRIMAAGLALCMIFALLANHIVPSDTSDWKNPFLNDILSRIKDSQHVLRKSPFSLSSSGLNPEADRLGGDISLDHRLVLKVKTNHPMLLKGTALNYYSGSGWEAGDVPYFRLNGENSNELSEVFDLNIPRNSSGENPLKDAMLSSDTEVAMMFGGYTLFTSGRVFNVSAKTGGAEFFFNLYSEIFSVKHLPTRFTYSFQSLIFNKRANNLPNRIKNIETLSAMKNNPSYDHKYDGVCREYLQLPAGLPKSVSQTALGISNNSAPPYVKMVQLESFLKTNFEYTLKPGSVPRNEDFVGYFLKTGRGYCTYFASAMAVMARTLGVPSRFVIGYGLIPESGMHDAYNYAAYTDNAHAWVECYFRGVGWIPFDPTAGSDYISPVIAAPTIKVPLQATGGNTSKTGITTAGAKTAASTTASKATTTASAASSSTVKGMHTTYKLNPLWLGVTAGILLVMVLAAGLLRIISQLRAYLPETVRARFKDNSARADYYYTDILRQLTLLRLAPETGETILQHGRRARRGIDKGHENGGDGEWLESAFDTVMKWRYGGIIPGDDDLKQIAEIHDKLEQRLRDTLSPVRYFLARLLFP